MQRKKNFKRYRPPKFQPSNSSVRHGQGNDVSMIIGKPTKENTGQKVVKRKLYDKYL